MSEYVCADCGHEDDKDSGPCAECKGMRVVGIKFVKETFGDDWQEAFAKPKFQDMQIFAWIGEDELGSGEVGIKAGLVPAGYVPLASKDQHKMEPLQEQLQQQANKYGKTIRLCRYQFVEEIITIEPQH